MEKIWNYLRANYAIILFAIVVVFFPFLFAWDAGNTDRLARICSSFAYALIVMFVLQCTQGWLRKTTATLLCIIAYAPNMIVLSYLLMDEIIMKSTDFWVVFNTNFAEATNLFSTIDPIIYMWGAIYTLSIIGALILVLKSCPQKKSLMWIQYGAILIWVGLSLINPFRSKVPIIDFYKSFWHYQKEQREVAEFYKSRQNLVLDVDRLYNTTQRNTILIIIGESQNQKHMSLYGYPRRTNPLLTEIIDELTIHKDVCSPAIHTLSCMKQILTFANYEHPDMYKKEANIIELLKSGGYKTFWFDNQGPDANGAFAIDTYTPTSYRTMAKQSDVYHAEGNKTDSIILPTLEAILRDTAQNKAIFLHLAGNHFDYSNRYGSAFSVFNDTIGICSLCKEQLNPNDIQIINAYDNATLYNDYIVRSCIELLRKDEGASAMLYLSDHGEEVFDYQYLYTRSFEKISPAMCEPPLIIWMNTEYRKSCRLAIDVNRPTCTDDIIYGIMDIAGIRYHMYDSTRSIYSPRYISRERRVKNLPLQEIRQKYNNN